MPFRTYDSLRAGIDDIISSGKDLSSTARGRSLARRNWEIGDAIHEHLVANQGKSTHGEGVIRLLADDVNLNKSEIYRMLRFRRNMPKVGSIPLLTWTHYVQIISLKPQKQREFYERTAASHGWNVPDLKRQIRDDAYALVQRHGPAILEQNKDAPIRPLTAKKGQLYTYRLKRALPGQTKQGDFVVGLGFGAHWPDKIVGIDHPKTNLAVTSKRSAASHNYTFTTNRDRGRKLYTVKALPERVIDGDTLLVRLDLGFTRWRVERLRFRGIDTPPLYSAVGRQASDFVSEKLATVPFVIITSSGLDPYGRYLADIFYLPGSDDPADVLAEGRFLNRQLLDEGLARPYL